MATQSQGMTIDGTDKLTHTRGLELQNNCGDTIITDRWLRFERNLMQKETEYSFFQPYRHR